MKKNNDTKDYSEQLEFLNSQPYYASKKMLSSRQIFRYAVPARTVTKKHWLHVICVDIGLSRAWTWDWMSRRCGWRSHPAGLASSSTRGRSLLRWSYATVSLTSLTAAANCCNNSWRCHLSVVHPAPHWLHCNLEFLCTWLFRDCYSFYTKNYILRFFCLIDGFSAANHFQINNV